jgi:hypothetical protein
VGDKKVALVGMPLSDAETKLVRQGLAKKLGLTRWQLEPQKDEVRKIQRIVVVELYKEQEELKRMAAQAEGNETAAAKQSEDEEIFYDEMTAMNTQLMELQGMASPRKQTAAQNAEAKKQKKPSSSVKEIEDDYLVGPLSIETYVIFRVRPLVETLERQALKLARLLQQCEVSTYLINAVGAVLAAINWTEWTSLTVAIVAVLTGIIEFTQLRNQLVQNNLSLRDLQTLLVRWDSLSIVMRRTALIKGMIVKTTEEALIKIVDAHTTAASNTHQVVTTCSWITSVSAFVEAVTNCGLFCSWSANMDCHIFQDILGPRHPAVRFLVGPLVDGPLHLVPKFSLLAAINNRYWTLVSCICR